MVYFAPITGMNSANVRSTNGNDETLKPQKHQESVQTGDCQIRKLNDGYSVVKYSDGRYEIYDPSGKKLSRAEMIEYVNNMSNEKPAESTKTSAPKNVMHSTYTQNKGDSETVKKYSAELSNFGAKYIDIARNRGEYGRGELLKAKNKLVRDEDNQKMFNECLGNPNKPALAMNGVLRTEDGTTLFMTRRQDISTREYYWDVQRIVPPRT